MTDAPGMASRAAARRFAPRRCRVLPRRARRPPRAARTGLLQLVWAAESFEDPSPEEDGHRQRESCERRRERECRPKGACDRLFDRADQGVARGRELRIAPGTVSVERLGEIGDLPAAGALELVRQVE